MLLHPAQEGFVDGEAGRGANDAVNPAARAGGGDALAADFFIHPITPVQAMGAENEQTVETAAKTARLDLVAVVIGGGMGADMVSQVYSTFLPL